MALASGFIIKMQPQLPRVCDEIAAQILELPVAEDPILPTYRVVRGCPCSSLAQKQLCHECKRLGPLHWAAHLNSGVAWR